MKNITVYTKPIPVNQRTMIIHGHQTSSAKWKNTKLAIQKEIQSQVKGTPLTGDLAVNILVYFGDNRKRDIDAYIKILLDSMNKIVYDDDSLITELHVFKEKDLKNPRTEIQIL